MPMIHTLSPQALAALEKQYEQLHQLALKEIQTILRLPKIARGDGEGFQNFAVRVRSFVGRLQERVTCAFHVQRLLNKLPGDLVSNFARHVGSTSSDTQYNLMDFTAWLEGEAECHAIVAQTSNLHIVAPQVHGREPSLRSKLPSPIPFSMELTESWKGTTASKKVSLLILSIDITPACQTADV